MMAEMIGNGSLTPEQKSITDQVVFKLYQDYELSLNERNYDKAEPPTLKTFYDILGSFEDPVAKQMHRALWTYVSGSYDLFAHQSNVDVSARMLIYDISQLGETIRTLGLKVVLESIRDQIIQNNLNNRRTYIYIDEIYLLLKDEYSENFLYEFWKWVRKFGASCTGMTQNVSDLLRSQKGSAMLSNSEFYIILGQDQIDLIQLKSLLSLSDEQVRFVQTARKGSGLIRFGNTIIPYADDFPKNTICYEMWNTDPQKSQIIKSEEFNKRKAEAKEYQRKKKESEKLAAKLYDSLQFDKERNTPIYKEMPVSNQNSSTPIDDKKIMAESQPVISESSEHHSRFTFDDY